MEHPLSNLLPFVAKPARYIGGEVGAAPPARPGDVRIVLCYPDVYEIGMSHRGFGNLYRALTQVEGVAAERCFAPWPDMAAALVRHGLPLTSLEGGLPLMSADVLGFSFATPLAFTTALMMLELGGVPLRARDRGESDPLVIGGGQAMFNAEPMAAFLDAVALGEGEELVGDVAAALVAARRRRLSRRERLAALAEVEGIYVPALYEPVYEGDAFAGVEVAAGAPRRPGKRLVRTLAALPAAAVIANLPPTHDRLSVEVMRGCVWGCRFCQAGMVTRPARERDAAAAAAEALSLLEASGATEVSLLGLNACDYSALAPLVREIRARRPGVRLALPAARVKTYGSATAALLLTERRGQQTFAPEVGTDRLRRVINKDFTNEEVIATVAAAAAAGCQNVKLYFMVGLPTEADEDAAAIGELVASCRRALREGLGRWGNVTAAAAPFVPQAHTPFQWVGMAPAATLARRIGLARKSSPRQVRFRGEVGARMLEGALARGDRRLGDVILDAYRGGARFDAWAEHYRASAWAGAFARAGLEMESYACRELAPGAPLPWGHIDAGVSEAFLSRELQKALKGEVTGPCAEPACRRCGACRDGVTVTFAPAGELSSSPARRSPEFTAKKQRLRFIYAKDGDYRWLSHHELWRLVRAQLARAGVALARTGGFAARERLVLAPALAVGVAGAAEYGEAFLAERIDAAAFVGAANAVGPFKVADAWEVPLGAPALEVSVAGGVYRAELEPMAAALSSDLAPICAAVEKGIASGDCSVATRRGVRDLGGQLEIMAWVPEEATVTFRLAAAAGAGVFDVVAWLSGVERKEARAARVTRTRVLFADGVGFSGGVTDKKILDKGRDVY